MLNKEPKLIINILASYFYWVELATLYVCAFFQYLSVYVDAILAIYKYTKFNCKNMLVVSVFITFYRII